MKNRVSGQGMTLSLLWLWLINKTLIYVFVIRVPLLLRSTWQWIIVATFGAKLMSKLKVLPGSKLEQLFLHFPPPLQSLLIPFNPGYLGSSRILELGPRNTSKDSQIYKLLPTCLCTLTKKKCKQEDFWWSLLSIFGIGCILSVPCHPNYTNIACRGRASFIIYRLPRYCRRSGDMVNPSF